MHALGQGSEKRTPLATAAGRAGPLPAQPCVGFEVAWHCVAWLIKKSSLYAHVTIYPLCQARLGMKQSQKSEQIEVARARTPEDILKHS
jgi:hypothetical protein